MASQVCTPWVTPEQMCCEGDQVDTACGGAEVPLVFPFTDEQIALAASNILYARTCFLYPGECEARIWPCIPHCWNNAYPCVACCGPSVIQVPSGQDFPIYDVEITENGVPLSPDAFRVERNNWIVRTDGNRFVRNSFGLCDGTETIISYSYGQAAPIELQMAAAALACELKKACNGSGCQLPHHVTKIARSGLEITLADLQKLLNTGMTGIPEVDYALSIHSNCANSVWHDPYAPSLGWGPAIGPS